MIALEGLLRPLKTLREVFETNPQAQLVASIPGLGPVAKHAVLVAFLTPIDRFRNVRQVIAYCGLCPTKTQSADSSYQATSRNDCNHLLQWILVEASWRDRRCRRPLGPGGPSGQARRAPSGGGAVTAAQRFTQLVYGVLRRGTPYTDHSPRSGTLGGGPVVNGALGRHLLVSVGCRSGS